jgi:hypothetical protein
MIRRAHLVIAVGSVIVSHQVAVALLSLAVSYEQCAVDERVGRGEHGREEGVAQIMLDAGPANVLLPPRMTQRADQAALAGLIMKFPARPSQETRYYILSTCRIRAEQIGLS